MRHLLGYARVSNVEQDLSRQLDALAAAGCWKTWSDKRSGARDDRPELAAALKELRAGDTLVVWRLDRLGRSMSHLLATVTELEARGCGFRSLQESIDTTTSAGRLVFPMFSALAEFERNLGRDRTKAGLAAARSRGHVGGRPPALSPVEVEVARTMYTSEKYSLGAIAKHLGVAKSTVRRHLALTGERS